jgi:hypothetical protein
MPFPWSVARKIRDPQIGQIEANHRRELPDCSNFFIMSVNCVNK